MKSMTGYGAAEGKVGGVKLCVEVRSVNQRHLDVKIVAPREYGACEAELRREVAGKISRGRVEVFVSRTVVASGRTIKVNRSLAGAYVAAWRELQREFDLEGSVELALLQGRQEIFQSALADSDPARETKTLTAVLRKALSAHAQERSREGAHLARDVARQAKRLSSLLRQVRARAETLAPRIASRLEKRLAELLDGRGTDPARVAQEAAIIADRADVREEIVRLASHLDALSTLVRDAQPVGKRVEFLLQEIGRELNTIGSKAGDLEVTKLVLDAKACVEKIREQSQNVE
jgi:uncharacterized protein (TIGR00255 family)